MTGPHGDDAARPADRARAGKLSDVEPPAPVEHVAWTDDETSTPGSRRPARTLPTQRDRSIDPLF